MSSILDLCGATQGWRGVRQERNDNKCPSSSSHPPVVQERRRSSNCAQSLAIPCMKPRRVQRKSAVRETLVTFTVNTVFFAVNKRSARTTLPFLQLRRSIRGDDMARAWTIHQKENPT